MFYCCRYCIDKHTGGPFLTIYQQQIPEGFGYKDLLTCAGQLIGGKSVCAGDSGGPLVRFAYGNVNGDPGRYYQIGVTQGTYNIHCDIRGQERHPSIFTRTENTEINKFIRTMIGLEGKSYSHKNNIIVIS